MDGFRESARHPAGAERFRAPDHAPFSIIDRPRLLDLVSLPGSARLRVLLIEGQPGQGKTVFAQQVARHLDLTPRWFTLCPEDGDADTFAAAVHRLITAFAPDIPPPPDEPAAMDSWLDAAAEALPADSSAAVIMERVEHAPQHLLESVVRKLFGRVVFILASRVRTPLRGTVITLGGWGLIIDNDTLAMSRTETARLLEDVFAVTLAPRILDRLHVLCDGWPAGIAHIARVARASGVEDVLARIESGVIGDFGDFFSRFVMHELTVNDQKHLVRMSLVDEGSAAMIRTVAGDAGAVLLDRLAGENRFVRHPRLTGASRIAPLLRSFLNTMAADVFDAGEADAVYAGAARAAVEDGDIIRAVSYADRGRADAMLEQILFRHGIDAVMRFGGDGLRSVLSVARCADGRPWYCFFSGWLMLETEPAVAGPLFDRSAAMSADAGDRVGEAAAVSQSIVYHTIVDGAHEPVAALLSRGEALFSETYGALDPGMQFLLIIGLAHGYCFAMSDVSRSSYYSSIALSIAERHRFSRAEVQARFVRGFEFVLSGRWVRMTEEIERIDALVRQGAGGASVSYLRILEMAYCAYQGDRPGFDHYLRRFFEDSSPEFINQTIFRSYHLLLEVMLGLSEGDAESVERELQKAYESSPVAMRPHMQSYFRGYEALAAAMAGRLHDAWMIMEDSVRIRERMGGRIHRLRIGLLDVATVAIIGDTKAAGNLLDRIARTVSVGPQDDFVRVGALVYRTLLALIDGDEQAAEGPARESLGLMRKLAFTAVPAWGPGMAERFIAFAVRRRIETGFAGWLAQKTLGVAFTPDGEPFPMLRIRTLGGLECSIEDGGALSSADFTPNQRGLLGLLLASPKRAVSQEDVQLALWPESPADKSRSNFDTLLTRLRKVLMKITGDQVKRYISVSRGIVRLTACIVDAEAFIEMAETGLAELSRRRRWVGDTALIQAMDLWQGTFLPELSAIEPVYELRERIERLLTTIALARSESLDAEGRAAEADEVLASVFREMPVNHEIAERLYLRRRRVGDAAGAVDTLRAYRRALVRDDYTPEEIDEVVEGVRRREEKKIAHLFPTPPNVRKK